MGWPGLLAFIRYGFLAAFAVLMGFTANAYLALGDVQNRIRFRVPENTIWAAAQAEIELGRTLAQLAPIAAGQDAGAKFPFQVQFDILWSRADLFINGALAIPVEKDVELRQVFGGFARDLKAADQLVGAANAGDRPAALQILDLLSPHRESLRKLTMASLENDRREREKLSRDHDLMQEQLSRFGFVAAILLGLLLTYLIHAERRARHLLADANKARSQMEESRTRTENQATQLKLLARKATTASQAKSEFLAMMSHDIRTPLNAIIGLSEIMSREETDNRKRGLLDTMMRASEGLLALINDILDLTRLEAGKLVLAPVAFSPAELVHEVMDVTAVLASQNCNTVSVDLDPALPDMMTGDRDRIRQVLMNLVGNANKFTVNGTVAIRIAFAGKTDGKTLVRFAVSDSGKGISDDLRQRLFQPFEQGEASGLTKSGSSGLGLAISERLVRLMGGSISLESEPGEGSTFSFDIRLGMAEAPKRGSVRVPEQLGLDLTGRRVLVVDDTPASLLVARTMFANFGAQVVSAKGGEEAVALGRAQAFDLVVLDVQMPGVDGPAAMKMLREEGASRHAVIAALTAQSFPRDRARLLASGFDAYISKPVRMRDIEAALAPLLEAGPAGGVAISEAVTGKEPEMAEGVLDEAFLATMREDVGEETMLVLINQVETEVEACLARIEATGEPTNSEELRQAAHKLAGLSGQFGLVAAHAAARSVEEGSAEGADSDQVVRLAELARIGLKALRRHLHQPDLNQTDKAA